MKLNFLVSTHFTVREIKLRAGETVESVNELASKHVDSANPKAHMVGREN